MASKIHTESVWNSLQLQSSSSVTHPVNIIIPFLRSEIVRCAHDLRKSRRATETAKMWKGAQMKKRRRPKNSFSVRRNSLPFLGLKQNRENGNVAQSSPRRFWLAHFPGKPSISNLFSLASFPWVRNKRKNLIIWEANSFWHLLVKVYPFLHFMPRFQRCLVRHLIFKLISPHYKFKTKKLNRIWLIFCWPHGEQEKPIESYSEGCAKTGHFLFPRRCCDDLDGSESVKWVELAWNEMIQGNHQRSVPFRKSGDFLRFSPPYLIPAKSSSFMPFFVFFIRIFRIQTNFPSFPSCKSWSCLRGTSPKPAPSRVKQGEPILSARQSWRDWPSSLIQREKMRSKQ